MAGSRNNNVAPARLPKKPGKGPPAVARQRVEPVLPDVDRGWIYLPEQKVLIQKALITSITQTPKGTVIKAADGGRWRLSSKSLAVFFQNYWSTASLWAGPGEAQETSAPGEARKAA